MRRKKLFFFFLACTLAQILALVTTADAQSVIAVNQNKKGKIRSDRGETRTSSDSSHRKQTLFAVLRDLNLAKGIYFIFADQSFGDIMVTPEKDMTLPIEHILASVLKDHNLQFSKLNNNTYIIYRLDDVHKRIGSESQSTNAQTNTRQVRGKVISAEGSPLSNVNVTVKGTSRGIVTDNEGFFTIDAAKGEILLFSFVGYLPKELVIQKETPSFVTEHLTVSNEQMDEVIVTSLGIKKSQRSIGYAFSSVTAEEVTASGNTNFASALYGKAPGVKITTAPGGATSAVQVQVRGLNSLNFNSQPLYVVDGIIIRNTNEKGFRGVNNYGYWDDQRIRGNGILDINPSDIESITVLKGASATTLYGSEAATGVVVISTKKGSPKKGLGVQVNYTGNVEAVAFLPEYQNVYGPGYDKTANLSEGATEEGWIPVDMDFDGVNETMRPNFRAYTQFGPKMEGQLVPWWDGQLRPYSPQPDNYKNLYRKGFSSIMNASIANQTEKANYRFSYTRNDYKGIQVGGNLQRNTLNVNSSFKVTEKATADLVVHYINSRIQNRPYQLSRVIASYNGFFSRAEDVSLLFDKFQTSEGYKWVPWNQQQRNPAEAFRYEMKSEAPDYLWNQLRNKEIENQHRLLGSLTLNYSLAKDISLRGRIGTDVTNLNIETRSYNEYPVEFNGNTSTGNYGVSDGNYAIFYGDLLLTYKKKINNDIGFSINGGYQARDERYKFQSSSTTGGLVKENWFSLSNSYDNVTTKLTRTNIFKNAFLGFINVHYKDFLFIEGTGRQEYSSTLPPGNNSYFYSSVNSGFIFSEAFTLPAFISYGKVRASYGLVGNAPPAYASGVAYTQSILATVNGPVTSLSTQINAGNNEIRPENKYEMEFGMETKLFGNRIGMDITYYNSRTIDQILQLTVPASSCAISKLLNAG
jgi:iron complex outermembrane recepter protein